MIMKSKMKEDNEINRKRTKQIGWKLAKRELGNLKERKKKDRNISNKKCKAWRNKGQNRRNILCNGQGRRLWNPTMFLCKTKNALENGVEITI